MNESFITAISTFPNVYAYTGIQDDKILHFAISAIIAFPLFFLLKGDALKNLLWVSVSLIFVGILKETADYLIPGRNVEFLDVVSNVIGAVFAYYAYSFIISLKNFDKTGIAMNALMSMGTVVVLFLMTSDIIN